MWHFVRNVTYISFSKFSEFLLQAPGPRATHTVCCVCEPSRNSPRVQGAFLTAGVIVSARNLGRYLEGSNSVYLDTGQHYKKYRSSLMELHHILNL
jgi:hypothetical protein